MIVEDGSAQPLCSPVMMQSSFERERNGPNFDAMLDHRDSRQRVVHRDDNELLVVW